MKALRTLALLPLLYAPAVAAGVPQPTPAQLSGAISKQAKRTVPASDLRPLKCEDIPEEPTEFECRWTQKVGGKWQRFSTYFALDGTVWTIIDWPPSGLK